MTDLIVGLLAGAIAGTHIATWGMYKDSPHEGFTWRRYGRGTALAMAIAAVAVPLTGLDLTDPAAVAVFFGTVYAAERAVEEFYKTFLREEDQSKYTIPMQLHVLGRVVESRAARWLAGAGVLAVVAVLVLGVRSIQRPPYTDSLLVLVAVGTVASWVSAVGGAWKDAPIEGFETLKFFRSPGIALVYALLLSRMTDDLLLLALASAGYTVATIETYKTFLFPSRPRGKFSDKPVLYPDMLRRRQAFVPLYVFLWAVILAGLGAGIRATL